MPAPLCRSQVSQQGSRVRYLRDPTQSDDNAAQRQFSALQDIVACHTRCRQTAARRAKLVDRESQINCQFAYREALRHELLICRTTSCSSLERRREWYVEALTYSIIRLSLFWFSFNFGGTLRQHPFVLLIRVQTAVCCFNLPRTPDYAQVRIVPIDCSRT